MRRLLLCNKLSIYTEIKFGLEALIFSLSPKSELPLLLDRAVRFLLPTSVSPTPPPHYPHNSIYVKIILTILKLINERGLKMVLNNILTIILQMPFRLAVILMELFVGFHGSNIPTETERIAREKALRDKPWIIFYVILLFYFVIGVLLKDNKSKIKNLLSVSSLFILGSFIAFLCLIDIKILHSYRIETAFNYLFSFEIPFIKFDRFTMNFNFIAVHVLQIIIPTLMLWAGLETKIVISKLISLIKPAKENIE